MKNSQLVIIQTTFEEIHEAKAVIAELLELRLIACAQIDTIESFYRYRDENVETQEFRLSLKTHEGCTRGVIAHLTKVHTYETPQIIVIPILACNISYLEWCANQVGPVT